MNGCMVISNLVISLVQCLIKNKGKSFFHSALEAGAELEKNVRFSEEMRASEFVSETY